MRAQQRDEHSDRDWSDVPREPSAPDAPAVEHPRQPQVFFDACDRELCQQDSRRLHEHLERQANAIGQALHDESGQLLTAAHLALAEASTEASDSVRQRLVEVRAYLDAIEEQLRRIAHEIRPRLLEDVGLVPALEFLAENVEKRRGFAITIDADRRLALPRAVETTVYRVVQEGLNNIARHASAAHVHVRVRRVANTVHCTIEDDGVGFDVDEVLSRPGDSGLGLAGIRERVRLLGGQVDVRSVPRRGTDVVIAIPLTD